MRHLISGEDCAIAGEATAATAAPVADTFRKSRRFIETISLIAAPRHPCGWYLAINLESRPIERHWSGRLTWKTGQRIRDNGMTGAAFFDLKSAPRDLRLALQWI